MRRLVLCGALVALALALRLPVAHAQGIPVPGDQYGYCTALTVPQTVSASCTVTVFNQGTSTPASNLFSDEALTVPLASSFTAAQNGTWRFYVAAPSTQAYDIQISGGLPALTPYTILNVIPGSGSFTSAPPYTVFGNCTNATAAPAFCSIVNAMLTAPGATTSVIYNSSGLFAGTSLLTWNNATTTLAVSGATATPSLRMIADQTAANAGKIIFGTGSAPYLEDLTSWQYTSRNGQDVFMGPASNPESYRFGGDNTLTHGEVSFGDGSAQGLLFLNDGTSSAGVLQGPDVQAGNGTPVGTFSGRIGSLFMRADGTATTALYLKEAGTGNTGWQQFAMQDDVQTLTNKNLSDSTTFVVNAGTPSKRFGFNASGITATFTQTFAASATANRIATFPDASITVSGLAAYSCGTTTTCANTVVPAPHQIWGQVALSSGTPSTATVIGISPAYTSTTSYQCTATDMTTATNNLLKITNSSTSSFTITGPATVTDLISYICVGN